MGAGDSRGLGFPWRALALVCWFLVQVLWCHDVAAADPAPLLLHKEVGRYTLASHLVILEDPEHSLTPAEAASERLTARYAPLPSAHYSPGYSRSAWWARMVVRNDGHSGSDWLLVQHQRSFEQIDVFVPNGAGGWRAVPPYGEDLGDGLRARYGYPVFHLDLPPDTAATVLVRIENVSPIRFSLELTTPYSFFIHERLERIMIGIALAVPLVISLQILLLWAAIGVHSHLLFAGMQLSLLLAALWLTGNLGEWVPALTRHQIGLAGVVGFNLAFMFGILHVRSFLQLDIERPHLARALPAIIVPFSLLDILLEALGVHAARPLTIVAAFVVVLAAATLSWSAALRRQRYGLIYAWAWTMQAPSLLALAASHLDLADPTLLGYAHLLGGTASALVFSFALWAMVATRERERREAVVKTEIVAAAHHDLRQPLHSLGIFLQLLEEQPVTGKARDLLRRMQVAHHALDDFLDSLLHLARHGRSALAPAPEPFAIHALLGELAVEYREQARQYGLQLRYVPSRAWICSDKRLLGRIVRNLLTNALRYTAAGRVLLGCRRQGDHLCIEVWDTGPGIPEEQLQKLFEPFAQGAGMQQGRVGFGLGLTVVHQLSNALGHRLHVRSLPGRGTCFTLVVPLDMPPTSVRP